MNDGEEDSDGDGVVNGSDSHPGNALLWEDWDGDGDNDSETDSDSDGHADMVDSHPADPACGRTGITTV